MNYNIDFNRIIYFSLPSFKRRGNRLRWLSKLLSVFQLLHNDFVNHADTVKEEVSWNGQKSLLERRLNIAFGNGIVIVNQDFSNKVQIIYESQDERNPIIEESPNFNNPIIKESATGFFQSVGFIVEVPASLSADLDLIRRTVDFYLIGSSSFEVVEV